jgi:hypothetical protein
MPTYADSAQLYDTARHLFNRIQAEIPGAANQVMGSRLLIRLQTSDPAGEIWINGRQRPLATAFGPARSRPDLDITLPADTLHRILLGELSLKKALGNGNVQVRGPVWKAKALADLFYHGQSIYPQVLQEQGLG